ncbi:hypothetical protein TWF481_007069 [Arthrobotrys musiformis]|uniref:RNA helicase n=1 Tax=Arthrobotrys musiformis TaxID=47236 RepID=A0AAV9WAB7_9PEZI
MPPKKPSKAAASDKSKVEPAAASSSSKGKGKAPPAATGSNAKGKGAAAAAEASEPPKPSLNEIIGGKGWTGKLPVTIFYELTVKNRWDKPEYTNRQSKEGHQSSVIIRSKNPKTQETETIRFDPPSALKTVPTFHPTALEARHFAATYALHRVYSGRNLQYALPPTHRPYWQAFEAVKKEDVKQGLEYKYSEDPFQVQRDRIAAEAEKAAAREKAALVGTVATTGAHAISSSQIPKGWAGSVLVNMGKGTRGLLEKFIRLNRDWKYDNTLDNITKHSIVGQLTSAGFRISHAEEACEWATNLEDALEWLLIHVPEDDMPAKYLPDNYTVGAVAFVTDSLAREYAAKRISGAGYPIEAAREALAACSDNETRAAEILMQTLVYGEPKRRAVNNEDDLIIFDDEPEFSSEQWQEEQASLEAIYGDKFIQVSEDICQIKLEVASKKLPAKMLLEVRKPCSGSYPDEIPVWAVISEPLLPSHVRLSLIRRIADYAEPLKGGAMIFGVVDWLETSIEEMVDRPGKLKEVSSVVAGAAAIRSAHKHPVQKKKNAKHRANPIDWTPGLPEAMQMLKLSEERMDTMEGRKMMTARRSLPAWNLRAHITECIDSNSVTVISGETGSGKSTQCVQFVLDDLIRRNLGTAAKIICTQPRRISAIGLAERVSAERCVSLGTEIGYAIRGESKIGPNTRIAFMTTGVLLRRLHDGDGLSDVSHVFIDEVHERSLDSDFLLVLMKRLLTKRKDLKLVLMSATLDARVFAEYFGNVQIVNIEGRTFPVNDFYLDDILRFTNFNALARGGDSKLRPVDADTADVDPAIGMQMRALGKGVNYELIAATVEAIDENLGEQDGSILIFLPGTLEIHRAIKAINDLPESYRYLAYPLHASLTPAEQRKVFLRAPKGQRKIICATNVAETSITIEDIVAVIDTGRVKETLFDPETRMIRLTETWASRASCKQRRGRAGRVREGDCYKLYTRVAEMDRMKEATTPEILRVPLENICLTIKAMGVKDVGTFLRSALTPPDTRTVDAALKTLTRMGALKDDDLTGLGKHLSTIPADVRSAKLMIYGSIFGCVDAALTIASILAVKSPFVVPREKRDESKEARSSFGNGNGDLIADYQAFEEWSNISPTLSHSELRSWCEQNMLSLATLNDIRSNKSQYISSLQEIGFLPLSYHKDSGGSNRSLNSQNNNDAVVRAIVASSFSPQIARIQLPEKKYAATMSGAKELDPEARTIKYFTEDERAFLHPSSTLFDAQTFRGNAAFMAFASKVSTSKVFIRDVTPVSAYGLLLLGGSVELDMSGRGVRVDGWVRVKCWLRIGVLIKCLRVLLDRELQRKVEDPGLEVAGGEVVGLVRRLIEFDGMDPM